VGSDAARFLEDMCPASVVRKSIRLRQPFTAPCSRLCSAASEQILKACPTAERDHCSQSVPFLKHCRTQALVHLDETPFFVGWILLFDIPRFQQSLHLPPGISRSIDF